MDSLTKWNISTEDNFNDTMLSHISNVSNLKLIRDNRSNYQMTSSGDSDDDSNMSIDSSDYVNQNKPLINQNYHKRRKPLRRMLQFKKKGRLDKRDNDFRDSIMADAITTSQRNAFLPSSTSTMINEPLLFEPSAKQIQQFCVPQSANRSCSSIETWSIIDHEESIPIQQHYIRREIPGGKGAFCSREPLSTIGSSIICRDEFSLDMHYFTVPQQPIDSIKYHKVEEYKKQKQPQRLLKLRQVMKNVAKGLVRKTRTVESQQTATNDNKAVFKEPCAREVYIHDKQAVARKLHRFRESILRNDTRNLQTLATL